MWAEVRLIGAGETTSMTDGEIQVEIAKQIRDKLAALATKLRETALHNGPPDKENAESNCRRDRQTRVTLVSSWALL